MENAKIELQNILAHKAEIKCAFIYLGRKEDFDPEFDDEDQYQEFLLKCNYSNEDLESFYDSLDFEYHDGYGSQNLFGIVWLKDGSWLARAEYYGSEWWEHIYLPEIPQNLL